MTIHGPINQKTGMILNTVSLQNYMERAIIKHLDHKNLDVDVSYFSTHPSTTQNVAVFIWHTMKKIMLDDKLLYSVKVSESENNFVIFKGVRV